MSASRLLVLVDDCRIEAMLVEDALLSSEEFTDFRHIEDSRTACETIAELRPAAVLLDLRMPGLSGWEVLDQLRERGLLGTSYVAILSNSSSPADQTAAVQGGARDYFVKPFESDGYVEIIDKVAAAVL